jgi:hypothetical protein
MPLIFKDRITRTDLRSQLDALFVFGDNEARSGMGGQAKECRGERNAVGVATKRGPSMAESAMWSDADFDRCTSIIDRDLEPVFEHIKNGGVVVFPASGIGTGLSQLPTRAPRIMEHIRNRVRELKWLGK